MYAIETNRDAKQWATFTHLATFTGYVIPLGWVLGPLVLWLIKKDEYGFVDHQGKQALNFQINLLGYLAVSILLSFFLIGIPLLFLLAIAAVVLPIVAAVKASKGEYYRYPFVLIELL